MKLLFGLFFPLLTCVLGWLFTPAGERMLVLRDVWPSWIHRLPISGLAPKSPPPRWLSGEVAIREMGITTLLWGLALPSLLLALCSPYLPPPPLPLTIIYVCKNLKCFSSLCSVKIRDAMHWKRDQGLL